MSDKRSNKTESHPKRHYEETLITTLGLNAELKEKPHLYLGAVAWTVIGIALTLFFAIFFGLLSVPTWCNGIHWFDNIPCWLYILGSFILAVAFVAVVFFLVVYFREPLLIYINRLTHGPIDKTHSEREGTAAPTNIKDTTTDLKKELLAVRTTAYAGFAVTMASASLLANGWVHWVLVAFAIGFAILALIFASHCENEIFKRIKRLMGHFTIGFLPIFVGLILLGYKLTEKQYPGIAVIIVLVVAISIFIISIVYQFRRWRQRRG